MQMEKTDKIDWDRWPAPNRISSIDRFSLILKTMNGTPQGGGQNHEFFVREEISQNGQRSST